ncbi:hypothetical protein FACS1894127_0720 [Clostridia bacterium]|nr:hypothetical protein FACS1894127_0720 [Clostridia bacterium]
MSTQNRENPLKRIENEIKTWPAWKRENCAYPEMVRLVRETIEREKRQTTSPTNK